MGNSLMTVRVLPAKTFRRVLLTALLLAVLPSVASARELVAAVPGHFPPQYVVTADGISGFAVEVMDLVASRMGHTVRYVDMGTWEDAQEALRRGEVDLIPNMGVTTRRELFADFSAPVETFPVSIFVRSDYDEINGVEDLSGHKVAVVELNVGYTLVKDMAGVEAMAAADRYDALFYLLSGQADALVYPEPLVLLDAGDLGLLDRIKIAGRPLAEIKRSIAVRSGDNTLLAEIDTVLPGIVASDEYEAVFRRWHGTEKSFFDWRQFLVTSASICSVFLIVFLLYRFHAKRIQALIQINEKRYRQLFARMMVAFALYEVVADAEGNPVDYRFVDVNERFEQLTGFHRKDVIGRTLLEVFPDFDPDWLSTFHQVLRERSSAHFEAVHKETGKDLDILAYAPARDQLAVMVADITDRKQVERIKQDVEHIMMHDLRAPLQGIVGLPALLGEAENLTREQRETLGHIEAAGHRMLHQLNLSMDMFKLEAGSYDYCPLLVDPCQAVQDVTDTMESKARAASVVLVLRTDGDPAFVCPSPARVQADPVLLHSALLNLVTNAVEASPPGAEVEVVVGTGEDCHTVSIRNQGAVPLAMQDCFFNKYATHGKRNGTGVGTYSAKLMIEAMGGIISMDTSESSGTVVTVTLPRDRSAEDERPQAP